MPPPRNSRSKPAANQESGQPSDRYQKLVATCCANLHRKLGTVLPELVFVLGSGFQSVPDGFRILERISCHELPGFPVPSVSGHPGTILLAELENLPCLVCSGRVHYYEGHTMEAVTFPIRVLAASGARELVLTNAAGGINRSFQPGDFMLFADHINFTGVNPLRGQRVDAGLPFVDLGRAYSPALRAEFLRAARQARVRLHSGVYLAVSGPSYETPAEIRAFRRLGADAVGMSTVPEVLMARALGLEVAAISCITNPAAGLRDTEISHREVLEIGRRGAASAVELLAAFARQRVAVRPKRRRSRSRKDLKIEPRILPSGARPR